MTVSYAGEVPNGSSFGCFWRILWKWRGSVYKLVWRELIAYLCLYYTINLVYRFVLNEQQQLIFTKVRIYFGQQGESIPMSFVLGFYVNKVVQRWWEQYRLLPWPDTLALFISAAIPNATGGATKNETGRLMRRNIMRYMVLAYVITLQRISLRVKRRFPTTQHLVDAGLMHESESKIFDALNAKSPMSKYWMPLVWATNIINRARKEGLITSDHIVQTILMELSDIRRRLGGLIGYDTVCVPLVYTQVVTLVLYTYFIAALVGRQMLPNMPDAKDPDLYFPFFTVLQFVFYVGWLKVAEVLINPFGEDDDDIELNWLIDRHIKAAYLIVDEMHEEHPDCCAISTGNVWCPKSYHIPSPLSIIDVRSPKVRRKIIK
uniref:Bestrophin homolog n=1 Tax=Bactrocera dorsalis TaxID=27457 RepID=A0A034VX47_BACDO